MRGRKCIYLVNIVNTDVFRELVSDVSIVLYTEVKLYKSPCPYLETGQLFGIEEVFFINEEPQISFLKCHVRVRVGRLFVHALFNTEAKISMLLKIYFSNIQS